MRIHEGKITGVGKSFAIVSSRFNNMVSDRLVEGALDCLNRHEVKQDDIDLYKVPGAYEIIQVTRTLAREKRFDAVICLGAIIRGDTPHFDFIAGNVIKGIMQMNLDYDIPVVLGIITADSFDQAMDRAGGKLGNRGFTAAMTALELANLKV